MKWQDGTSKLREAFPGEKFKVTFKPSFNVRAENDKLSVRKIHRVVARWFKAAYGVTIKWGKVQHVPAKRTA